MLEILLLIFLCRKKLGPMMRAKGRSAFGYQFLLVASCLAGEFLGVMTGTALHVFAAVQVPAYPLALIGAVAGCVVAFVVAKSVPPIREQRGFEVVPAEGPSPVPTAQISPGRPPSH